MTLPVMRVGWIVLGGALLSSVPRRGRFEHHILRGAPHLYNVRGREVEYLGEYRVLIAEKTAAWDKPRRKAIRLHP